MNILFVVPSFTASFQLQGIRRKSKPQPSISPSHTALSTPPIYPTPPTPPTLPPLSPPSSLLRPTSFLLLPPPYDINNPATNYHTNDQLMSKPFSKYENASSPLTSIDAATGEDNGDNLASSLSVSMTLVAEYTRRIISKTNATNIGRSSSNSSSNGSSSSSSSSSNSNSKSKSKSTSTITPITATTKEGSSIPWPVQLPQLSERESIFATHYHSDSQSASSFESIPIRENSPDDKSSLLSLSFPPLLPPPSPPSTYQEQQQDVSSNLSHTATVSMEATSSTLLPCQTRPSTTIAPAESFTRIRPSEPSRSGPSKPSKPSKPSTPILSSFTPKNQAKQNASSDDSLNRIEASQSHAEHCSWQPVRMSTTWNRSEQGSRNVSETSQQKGNYNPIMESSRRSTSQGRPEEQIEATLANDEPVAHARSRKASHYLGLFKGKDSILDQNGKGRWRAQATTKGRDQGKVDGSGIGTGAGSGSGTDTETGAETHTRERQKLGSDSTAAPHGIIDQEVSKESKSRSTGLERDDRESNTELRLPLRPRFDRSTTSDTSAHLLRKLNEARESIEWRSEDPSQGNLPLRLLERVHDDESSDTDLTITPINTNHHDFTNQQVPSLDENEPPSVQNFRSSHLAADEDFDFRKEHISSATYYPHQGPSPENSEDNGDEDPVASEEKSDHQIKIQSSILPTSKPDGGFDAVYHKDLRSSADTEAMTHRPRPLSMDFPKSSGSMFTSDEESYDEANPSERSEESGVTDGDRTPTATPHIGSPYPRIKTRREPLRAVELKPYKHQVGGHSKVFSFSKQAICKQLNNRENEFYEVIERRHPELLKFLPRYLGVLNVTYRKAKSRKTRTGDESVTTKDVHGLNTTKAPEPKPVAPEVRIISHSQNYENHDDTIPQVIYANNLHIIPNNLFRQLPLSHQNAAPAVSRWNDKDDSTPVKNSSTIVPHLRPSPPKHHPSWGATTVNTKLKEKVLREVFSPPGILSHHYRHRRMHDDASSRESKIQPSLFDGSLDPPKQGARSRADSSVVENWRSEIMSPRTNASSDSIIAASDATSSVRASSSPLGPDATPSFASGEKVHTTGAEAAAPNARRQSIKRRRSAGGLYRKRHDMHDESTSTLEYYDEGYVGDKEDDIFPMDLIGLQTPPLTAPSSDNDTKKSKSPAASIVTRLSVVATPPESALAVVPALPPFLPSPVNPLQAQVHRDERVRHFLLLEDLTANMVNPCVLDLKMGTRQYGIEASKKKQISQRQKCKMTTSCQLGIRVCGMQVWNAKTGTYTFEDKYAGRDIQPGRDFQAALTRFLHNGTSYANVSRHIPRLMEKLNKLERIILTLPGYRFYASSLLLLYDGAVTTDAATTSAPSSTPSSPPPSTSAQPGPSFHDARPAAISTIDVRLVDFANCVTGEDPLPDGKPCPPCHGADIDRGYVRGLRSLRTYLQRVWQEVNAHEGVHMGEVDVLGEKGYEDWVSTWGMEDDGEVSL